MTTIAASRSRDAYLSRQSAIDHGGAHSNVQPDHNATDLSGSTQLIFAYGPLLASRSGVKQCLPSRSRLADAAL
jgi:hypothetical protein